MAMPRAGPSAVAVSSTFIGQPVSFGSQHRTTSRRLPRRPCSRFARLTPPSSGLLSILATIVASSATANCSPTPPSFLCPFIQSASDTIGHNSPRDNSVAFLPLTPTPTKRRRPRHNIPDRYQQDDDGRWRLMDIYTLYGSTICKNCPEPTNTPSLSAAGNPSHSDDTATMIDLDTLPLGWGTTVPRQTRTTLILVLSLVLAFCICFLIISCLFWRKTKKKKMKEGDIEKKVLARQRAAGRGGDESAAEKEVRVKQRIWARATARWKANARYVARQRRGKRATAAPRNAEARSSAVSLHDDIDAPAPAESVTTSPSSPPSRRCSVAMTNSESSGSPHVNLNIQTDVLSMPTVALSPPTPTENSPPAYHHRPRTPSIRLSINTSLTNGFIKSPSGSSSHSRRPSLSVSFIDTDGALSDEPVYTPSLHVATDDKALLSRLAELASAPPPGGEDAVAESSLPQGSAPVWRDEELEDFMEALHHTNNTPDHSHHHSPSLPFPPPPAKGKIPASAFYEYTYSGEDLPLFGSQPEPEPSAPPFEESIVSSAPPLEDGPHAYLLPSAPPLTVDYVDPEHHALDQASEYIDEQPGQTTEGSPVSYHTDHPSPVVPEPVGNAEHSHLVQGPIASDGTPPSYCP